MSKLKRIDCPGVGDNDGFFEIGFVDIAEHDLKIMALARDLGYGRLRSIDGPGVCGLFRFIYTIAVVYGIDEAGYRGRFCFETYQCASLFLRDWDGETLPAIGEDGCTAIK